jgi:hypothetical protein
MQFHQGGGFTTLDVMIAALEQHHVTLLERLYGLDHETWNHSAWLIQGEQEIILRDSIGRLLWIALFDAVRHGGQLSAYIRPMGGKVPSIYGPSADSAARQLFTRGFSIRTIPSTPQMGGNRPASTTPTRLNRQERLIKWLAHNPKLGRRPFFENKHRLRSICDQFAA